MGESDEALAEAVRALGFEDVTVTNDGTYFSLQVTVNGASYHSTAEIPHGYIERNGAERYYPAIREIFYSSACALRDKLKTTDPPAG